MVKGKTDRTIYWLLWGGFALLLLYLIWGLPYFPSQDGPSHLYNAWVLKEFGNPDFPLLNSSYTIRRELFPNWAGHALMFLLLHLFPPLITEKIWLTLIVLGIPGGTLILARTVDPGAEKGAPWWTLLAFSFALNQPLSKGFQNHALGLVLFIFILAYCWRNNRRGWSLARLLVLDLLLVASYFCHILSFSISLLAAVILRLGSRDSLKNNLYFYAALLPPAALLFYYYQASVSQTPLPWLSRSYLQNQVAYLLQTRMLSGFYRRSEWHIALSLLLGIGIGGTLASLFSGAKIERRNLLLLLVAVLLGIYFLSPDRIGGGSYIKMRLALYPLFPLLVWLKTPRRSWLKVPLICSIAILNLGQGGEFWVGHKLINRHYQRIVSLAEIIPDHSFAAADRRFRRWNQDLRPILHALSYGMVGRDIVNLTNYEARRPYFPIKWKKEVEIKWPIYFLSNTTDDYLITPVDRTDELEQLYRSEVTVTK